MCNVVDIRLSCRSYVMTNNNDLELKLTNFYLQR